MLNKRNLFLGVTFLTLIALLIYAVVRMALFLFSRYTGVEKFFSFLLLMGELFILMHVLGYVANLFKVIWVSKRATAEAGPLASEPPVAILVAARHEPQEVLRNTFRALRGLGYQNKTLYFLDDSSDEKYKQEAEELCRDYQAVLFRRESRHGAKAGIVNDCLKGLTEKYVAIFDADQSPLPQFLNPLIPQMEKDPKLAFIQTPQYYSNTEESRVARGAGFQQAVFYEYICEGKSTREAMFCCGTNIVFRREALQDVGGLDESTVTEDFSTSVELHMRGWKSLYDNHVYTFGMGPENLTGYFKQQFRWANGTISVYKKLLWAFLTRPFSLKPVQWWEYFLSGSYYFIGLAFFILMICPVMYLLFRIPSFFTRPEIYFFAYLPYAVLSVLVFYTVLGARRYKIRDLLVGQLLAFCTFPVYLGGACSALLGLKTTFGITEKTKGQAISYRILWPQLTLIYLNFIAAIWGLNRYIYQREEAILVNGFWALYHAFVLSSIFYFNEEEPLKIPCSPLIRKAKFEYQVIGQAGEMEKLGKLSWKDCFTVFLPERLKEGTNVMCKIRLPHQDPLIFDGEVIWASQRKGWRGTETNIGIVTIPEDDKMKLKRAIQK